MYFQRRMLPQIDALSLSPVKVFSIFIFHLLIYLNKAESQVVGPHQPVVALVDDDVILPCHVEPAEDVTAQILEWTRSDLNPRFVHVWRSGQDLVNTRNPSYRGRTSLFINELKRGNISLKLSRVKLSDEGTYECSIPLMEKKSFVNLVVASDAATSPVIRLSGIDKNRAGVVLQCESAGWYPEPELLWLDGEGNLLSAGPTETLRGPDDLYTVSSRVTVEKRHSNNITCRVQQRNTNQSRETHIHVPEDFFNILSSSPSVTDTSPVSLALCIILLIVSVVVLVRRKRKHIKTDRRPKDHTGDFQVSTDEDREKEQLNMKVRGKTENVISAISQWKLPITSRLQLQEEQQRREDAENKLGDLQNDKEKLENELQDEKKRNVEQEAKLNELQKKNTEIINQLQQEKETLEELKKQLESKNQEMIKSEIEKTEFIQKLMQTLLTLDSKLSISQHTELQSEKITENIKQQLQQVKETTATLKDQLEKNSPELQSEKKNTEIINQLQQTSDKRKNQLEDKNPEIIVSENEKDEIIQKLMETFPTLESKVSESIAQKTELSGNISQAQEEKQEMEREMERLRNELDSRNQQLQLSGNISQAQKEKQKMEREMERLRNELDSTKQQVHFLYTNFLHLHDCHV
ncbi:butyrophilin subfamily 3 member A3-like [Simochromis diagramma]|uniref:butyrophilin subfamily 3 member A3-like n=1 Tax=Simochromis diagramma TaxID=43689 RepID=UPI001A7ED565|nr:butyrophilin subfamily 3 member A3-like [Simochromis diagramma]